MTKRILSFFLLLAVLAALLSACAAEEPQGSSSVSVGEASPVRVPQRLIHADGKELYTRLYSLFVSNAEEAVIRKEAAALQTMLTGVLPHHPPVGGGDFDGEIYTDGDYVVTTDDQLKSALKRAKAGEVILIPKGSDIRFCVPQSARFLYVTYPADWQNG